MADREAAQRFLGALFPDVPDDGAILIWALKGRLSSWATSIEDAAGLAVDLQGVLGLTSGNLGVHLAKLEEAAYVEVVKEFVARKPRTTARLTALGRKAFLSHVARLDEVARRAEETDGG